MSSMALLSLADEEAIARAAEERAGRAILVAEDQALRDRMVDLALCEKSRRRRTVALGGNRWLDWYSRRSEKRWFLIFAWTNGARVGKVIGGVHPMPPAFGHRFVAFGYCFNRQQFEDELLARASLEAEVERCCIRDIIIPPGSAPFRWAPRR